MVKNPITDVPEVVEKEKRQGKRKRQETLCVDKRRDHNHCAICGSGDLAYEQLVYCEVCGAEAFYVDVQTSWRIPSGKRPCSCKGEPYLYRGSKTFYHEVHHEILTRMCLTCGSAEASTCPACHQKQAGWWHKCWTSPTGEKVCRNCGFRRPGYAKQ